VAVYFLYDGTPSSETIKRQEFKGLISAYPKVVHVESVYPAINPNPLSSPVVVGVLVVGSPTGELVGNVTVVGELTGDITVVGVLTGDITVVGELTGDLTVVGELTGDITVVGVLTGDITVAVAAEYLKRDPIVFL
jgi:hypothetical protein